MKKTNKSNWEKVGSVGADSGLIWVGDPCYCVTPDCNEHPAETWDKFCDKLFKNEKNGVCQWNYKMGPSRPAGKGSDCHWSGWVNY